MCTIIIRNIVNINEHRTKFLTTFIHTKQCWLTRHAEHITYEKTQIHQHKSKQIHQHINTAAQQHTNTPTHQHTSKTANKYTNSSTHQHNSKQIYQRINTPAQQQTNTPTHQHNRRTTQETSNITNQHISTATTNKHNNHNCICCCADVLAFWCVLHCSYAGMLACCWTGVLIINTLAHQYNNKPTRASTPTHQHNNKPSGLQTCKITNQDTNAGTLKELQYSWIWSLCSDNSRRRYFRIPLTNLLFIYNAYYILFNQWDSNWNIYLVDIKAIWPAWLLSLLEKWVPPACIFYVFFDLAEPRRSYISFWSLTLQNEHSAQLFF